MRHYYSSKSHLILKKCISKIYTNNTSHYNLNHFHFRSLRKNKVLSKQIYFLFCSMTPDLHLSDPEGPRTGCLSPPTTVSLVPRSTERAFHEHAMD